MKIKFCLYLMIVLILSIFLSHTARAAVDPDTYEVDDTSGQASIIIIDSSTPQIHNFHDSGDEDWVEFYAIEGNTYEIKVSGAGPNCDAVIALYSPELAFIAEMDNRSAGEEEQLSWLCPTDGVYYVKLRNYNIDLYGDGTEYDLRIYRPYATGLGIVGGYIKDCKSSADVPLAKVKSDKGGSAISLPDGRYTLYTESGENSLTVTVDGYQPASQSAVVPDGGEAPQLDFSLLPNGVEACLQSVYRFWSDIFYHHFYTISETEKDFVIVTWPDVWNYEGPVFSAYPNQVAGTLPIYRFWSDVYLGHFYTISEYEKNLVIATWPDVWRYEGPKFYAYPNQVTGTLPVYRFWSDTYLGHFYTISETDKNFVIATWPDVWTYEGPVFYTYP
jgi:hypothetical protein